MDESRFPRSLPIRNLRDPSERPVGPSRESIGARLQIARIRSFRTASEAARALGIAGPTFLAHENGTRAIRPDIAEFYAARFGVTADWLLFGRGAVDPSVQAAEALYKQPIPIGLSISSLILPDTQLIVPKRQTAEGTLLATIPDVWLAVARAVGRDWSQAYQIPADLWEQIVAGAFERAGYDEVTMTPRSGDFGRDVIAVKRGVGCVKVIGSVKAYAAHRRVPYDAVRALIGVLSVEKDASKGILATTSDFPPRIQQDRFIQPLLSTRLELMNGAKLREWLIELSKDRNQ